MTPLPVLFVGHGSPMIALCDGSYHRALRSFGGALRLRGNVTSVLVLSAHWHTPGAVRATAAQAPSTVHDFTGFPDELSALCYPSPGDPALARRALELTGANIDAGLDTQRGLDHGAWIPLRILFPAADVPVVQLSLPVSRHGTPPNAQGDALDGMQAERTLFSLGAALAPLRGEGVLIVASGNLTHTLREIAFDDEQAPVWSWAAAFESWALERALAADIGEAAVFGEDGLGAWKRKAPEAARVHPAPDHLHPLFAALGAASKTSRSALMGPRHGAPSSVVVYSGFAHGSLSMTCLAFE